MYHPIFYKPHCSPSPSSHHVQEHQRHIRGHVHAPEKRHDPYQGLKMNHRGPDSDNESEILAAAASASGAELDVADVDPHQDDIVGTLVVVAVAAAVAVAVAGARVDGVVEDCAPRTMNPCQKQEPEHLPEEHVET